MCVFQQQCVCWLVVLSSSYRVTASELFFFFCLHRSYFFSGNALCTFQRCGPWHMAARRHRLWQRTESHPRRLYLISKEELVSLECWRKCMHKCCDKLVVNEGLMSDSLNNEGQTLGWLTNYFRGERKPIPKAWNLQSPQRTQHATLGEAHPECKIWE